MHDESKAGIGLQRQFITCALMCGLAIVVLLLSHRQPYSLLSGRPLSQQAFVGLAIGGLYFASAQLGYKHVAGRQSAESMAESYRRLDLAGWNPVWIALAAGIGEELLFRGALQPVLGIGVTSLLFVLAHARAYRFDGFSTRVLIQALGIFALSVGLGFVSRYVGLLAAMIVHAAMDVVGLYTIRRMAEASARTAV